MKVKRMTGESASKAIESTTNWISLNSGLHVNSIWLRDGLIIAATHPDFYKYAEKQYFRANKRTVFYKKYTVKERTDVLSSSSINSESSSAPEFRKAVSFIHGLIQFQGEGSFEFNLDKNFYLESDKKEKDIFIPLLLRQRYEIMRFYLSPTLDGVNIKDFFEKFKGIKTFITAGCIFGAALQGVDKKGCTFPIISHKIDFVDGEKIVGIRFDQENLHPYEIAQFALLKDILPFMKKIGNKNEPLKLVYHLPGLDYVLSIVKLFIQNRVSYEVMADFYSAVKERTDLHIKMLNAIFENSGVILDIQSPFMNLFGSKSLSPNYEIILVENLEIFKEIDVKENEIYIAVSDSRLVYKILNPSGEIEEHITAIQCTLEDFSSKEDEITKKLLKSVLKQGYARGIDALLHSFDLDPYQEKPFANQKKLEQAIVEKILKSLMENDFFAEHKGIWKDFIGISQGKDKIFTLEKLFKIANAIMIAIIAQDQNYHEVCSLLPFNETPIFTQYQYCIDQFSADHPRKYPQILHLSVLERLISYSNFSEGNVFYLESNPSSFNSMLEQGALINPQKYFSESNQVSFFGANKGKSEETSFLTKEVSRSADYSLIG